MPRYRQFSFWVSVAPTKICFPRTVINCGEILLYLEARTIVLKGVVSWEISRLLAKIH